MKNIKLLACLAVAALAFALTASAQYQTANGYRYRQVNVGGAYPGLPASVTNGVNTKVTNCVIELQHGVGHNTGITVSPMFLNSAISNITLFGDVSLNTTNEADFTTTAPFVFRFAGTATGRVRPATNILASQLGGARWFRITSISNDAGAGLTAVTVYPTNIQVSANAGQ